jgi:hypothetical protein
MAVQGWSARRPRRSPRYDLGAVVVVLAVLALGVAGAHLLALGAAAFVAWLLHVARGARPEAVIEPAGARPWAVGDPYRSDVGIPHPTRHAPVGRSRRAPAVAVTGGSIARRAAGRRGEGARPAVDRASTTA